jgi:hypothetical protein
VKKLAVFTPAVVADTGARTRAIARVLASRKKLREQVAEIAVAHGRLSRLVSRRAWRLFCAIEQMETRLTEDEQAVLVVVAFEAGRSWARGRS